VPNWADVGIDSPSTGSPMNLVKQLIAGHIK
jgi:hypothetical protein